LHLNAQKISSRRAGKRDEFGNPGNRDIESEISQESSRLQAPGVSNKLLVTLIEVYETENYPIESEPHEILQHIMESSGTRQADLVGIIGSRGVVSEVVNGKRAISKAQAKALGDYFKISPSLFI
jgi:Predicted transcription regulator containing HTH domain